MNNTKQISYQDDSVIVYACGCRKGKLEAPEDEIKHCAAHHEFHDCDEWSRTCWCGATETI